MDLAALAGLDLDPWQQLVLKHSLGERPDGKWAAFEVGLVVGRQNGKNAVLEAREIAELFMVSELVGPRLIIHSAHQFKTALEHFRRVKALILRTPDLHKRVKGPIRRGVPAGIRDSHGEESIELKDGSRLLFAARTSSGGQGRGFTGDLLVWDEAMSLPDSVIGAVLPTLSAKTLAVPGVQVWYTGSAVNQQTMAYGVQLARIRERGARGDDPELMYAEWSVDPAEYEHDRSVADDPERWAHANPGLGVRIAVEHVARERRGAMPFTEFLVERLGIGDWPATDPESDRVIPLPVWGACAERDRANRITSGTAYAIDVNPDRTWASIGVAGMRDDGLWQFAVADRRPRSGWIVERCVELAGGDRRVPFVVLGRGPASTMVMDLEAAGLNVVLLDGAQYGRACGDFFDAIHDQTARYPFPQRDLDDALSGARRSQSENAWTWSRKASTSPDISSLVACTLALWQARSEDARYGTVLFLDDMPETEPEKSSDAPVTPVGGVRAISQAEQTRCFRCATGTPCPTHHANGA